MAGMASAPAGTVAWACAANRRAAIESIIEADALATCVRTMMADRTVWTGSASDLLHLYAENARAEILSGPAAAKVRHEAVCKAAGFYSPEEVKALRRRLGLSQEDLARLGGMGVATVSGVERKVASGLLSGGAGWAAAAPVRTTNVTASSFELIMTSAPCLRPIPIAP